MKKSTFEITIRDGKKAVRHGYVYGAFGIHKNHHINEWSVTHLKTGLSVHWFSDKKLSNVKALLTIINDRYNWDGNDIPETAKLNGMSVQDFITELRGIINANA